MGSSCSSSPRHSSAAGLGTSPTPSHSQMKNDTTTAFASSNGYAMPSDIIGVIAGFIRSTTYAQTNLMLVCHTWYSGVVQQDGMRAKPNINWPWRALEERQPSRVKISRMDDLVMSQLVATLPHLQELHVEGLAVLDGYRYLSQLTDLTSFRIISALNDSRKDLNKLSRHTVHILDAIAYLPHLTALAMVDFGLHEHHMGMIASNFPNLTLLDVSSKNVGPDPPTGVVFDHWAKLENLTSLDISVYYGDMVAGMEKVGRSCRQLRTLSASYMGNSLCHFPYLTTLHLCRCYGRLHLDSVSNLVKLSVSYWGMTDDSMEEVATLQHLESLVLLECPQLTDKGFKALRNPSLTMLLAARQPHLTDEGLKHIAAQFATSLDTLQVRSAEVTDVGIDCLASLEHLTNLDISGCEKVTGVGLKNLKTLHKFSASRVKKLTDATVKPLVKNNPHLSSLDLDVCASHRGSLSDLSAQYIATNLRHLASLRVDFVSWEGVSQIAMGCPHLTHLDLNNAQLSDIGLLRVCESLVELETLVVARNRVITSKGFEKLGNLKYLTDLTIHHVTSARFDAEVVLEFVAALPRLKVFRGQFNGHSLAEHQQFLREKLSHVHILQ